MWTLWWKNYQLEEVRAWAFTENIMCMWSRVPEEGASRTGGAEYMTTFNWRCYGRGFERIIGVADKR